MCVLTQRRLQTEHITRLQCSQTRQVVSAAEGAPTAPRPTPRSHTIVCVPTGYSCVYVFLGVSVFLGEGVELVWAWAWADVGVSVGVGVGVGVGVAMGVGVGRHQPRRAQSPAPVPPCASRQALVWFRV